MGEDERDLAVDPERTREIKTQTQRVVLRDSESGPYSPGKTSTQQQAFVVYSKV